jgi:hypothetical protein
LHQQNPSRRRCRLGSSANRAGKSRAARRLTERFPSIRAYPHGTTCPESVIRSASELWIQAAYMSHTEFYAVIDVARGCGISVHYFSGTGTTTAIDNLLK